MRKFLAFVLVLFPALSHASCGDELNASAKFESKILPQILRQADPSTNVMLTAPPLFSVLATVANGASGDAQKEMLHLLGVSDIQSLNIKVRAMEDQINGSNDGATVSQSGAMFVNNGFALKPEFLALVRDELNATVTSVPFAQQPDVAAKEVNAWASQVTHKMIDKIIEPENAASLELLLASALYFKGSWQYTFDKQETYNDQFMLASGQDIYIPMMHQTVPTLEFLNAGTFDVIRVPYRGGEKSMYIALPKHDWSQGGFKITAGEALLQTLDVQLAKFTQDPKSILTLHHEEFALPKFKLKYSNPELKDVLEQLNVHGIFQAGNLLGISDDARLKVAYVRGDFVLEINEEGAEAAGVASVGMVLESMGPKGTRVDRAFGYVIRDDKNGINLMSGVIQDPRD